MGWKSRVGVGGVKGKRLHGERMRERKEIQMRERKKDREKENQFIHPRSHKALVNVLMTVFCTFHFYNVDMHCRGKNGRGFWGSLDPVRASVSLRNSATEQSCSWGLHGAS